MRSPKRTWPWTLMSMGPFVMSSVTRTVDDSMMKLRML
jgi:hypothetical protein